MFGLDKLPDNTSKIYLILSVVAFYFIMNYYQYEKQKIDNDFIELTKSGDEHEKSVVSASDKLIKIAKTSEIISKRYKVKNPILLTDSSATLNVSDDTSKNYLAALDLILPIFLEYNSSMINRKVQDIKFNWARDKHTINVEYFKTISTMVVIVTGGCIFIFIASIFSLRKKEKQTELYEHYKRNLEKYSLREKGELKDCCQSCGRLFDSFVSVSKNTDGTYNYAFCSDCFKDGTFIFSLEDVKQMIINNAAIEEDQKGVYVEKLCKLDRWKENRYQI